MIKLFLQIFLFIFSSEVVFGQLDTLYQKTKKNNIQLDFGLARTGLIDEGFTQSKLLFRAVNSKLCLGYGRETATSIFNVSITSSIGKAQSKSGHLSSDFYFLCLSVEFLKKIAVSRVLKKESCFFTGIQLSSINYSMQNESTFDNISIYSLHGIYVNFCNQINLNEKQRLQFSYSMPSLIYTNHVLWNGGASNYTYIDKENIIKLITTHGKFSYFNLFNNIQLKANYLLKVGKKTDFQIKYAFFYANNLTQIPVHIYSNELLFGLKFYL